MMSHLPQRIGVNPHPPGATPLAGNMGKGECCSGFSKRVCRFISGKSSVTGDPLEA